MEAPPRRIKIAIALILSLAPAGTVMALITLLAHAQSSLTLPYYEDPREISGAMWHSAASQSSTDIRDQLLGLGILTAVATAAFGVTAWKVWRGTRRPTLLLAMATGLTAIYVAMLWIFLKQPSSFFIVSESRELTQVIDLIQPGWYAPLRVALLVAGTVAQVLGLVLLTSSHGVSWLARHQKQPVEQESPPLWASPSRQATVLMLLTPALLLIYAAVNYVGCLAGLINERGEPDLLPGAFLLDMQVHVQYLAIPAIAVVVGGLILLLSHGRARAWAGLTAGFFGLPYTVALVESALHYSDTSLFHNYVATGIETPWWNQPAVSTTGIVILLLHFASLALLFRAPTPQNKQHSSASR
ncbi:hypothetical protein [Nonomuraea guangzhouensis]|uniref:Uncharacterized protein n=1 Tax=Nonomuraea guangzhouensis TaxID=1291555 RepID=A0ABW4GGD5_9ACTN|nr:hypothetical protein [Nonomuraea guangzhouensis]